jgi:hypothetical protein
MWDIATIENNGILQFEINTSEGKMGMQTTKPPAKNKWTHIVLTFNGEFAKFYFDGQLENVGEMVFGNGRDAALTLGCAENNGNYPFNGRIDEFRMYNRELTENEVSDLYAYTPDQQVGIKKYEFNRDNLIRNFPNPFSTNTNISFTIDKPGFVDITLYNCTGEKVKTLLSEFVHTKESSIIFNGSKLPGGVYYCTLKENQDIKGSAKIIILK